MVHYATMVYPSEKTLIRNSKCIISHKVCYVKKSGGRGVRNNLIKLASLLYTFSMFLVGGHN